jgi:hypothetical protein
LAFGSRGVIFLFFFPNFFCFIQDKQGGAHGHDGKKVTYREYADLYYGTFLNHSRTRNANAIIWSRPVDSFANWAYLKFSPRYATFSGWVGESKENRENTICLIHFLKKGDQDPTFGGLLDAMNNMLRSAWANAVSFGSDTGGYRCCGSTDKVKFVCSWLALKSCCRSMEEQEKFCFDGRN